MTAPDPDPKVEAARLAYLDAQATADAHYAVAYAASGGKPSSHPRTRTRPGSRTMTRTRK